GPCRGTSRRKIEELAGASLFSQAAALERSARRPRIATRLPAVSHIASIKYPTLLTDPALANDNKNCSRASPSRDLALDASPPSPQQTAAGCAAPSRAAEGRVAPHAWAGFSRDWALPGPLSRLPVRELTSVHECRDIRQEPT